MEGGSQGMVGMGNPAVGVSAASAFFTPRGPDRSQAESTVAILTRFLERPAEVRQGQEELRWV